MRGLSYSKLETLGGTFYLKLMPTQLKLVFQAYQTYQCVTFMHENP